MVSAANAIVWTDAAHVELVEQVLDQLSSGVHAVGVGGPRSSQLERLGRSLDCHCDDDIRKLLVECPAQFLWLLTMEGIDTELGAEAIAAGITLLGHEPLVWQLEDFAKSTYKSNAPGSGRFSFIPSFEQCPGWKSAAEPQEVLGPPQLIRLSSYGKQSTGSIAGRLYDAWTVVLRFGDLPESIDASLIGPVEPDGPGMALTTGHIAVHARMGAAVGGWSCLVDVSDQAGLTYRELRVIGEGGHLWVRDEAYSLLDRKGQMLDQKRPPRSQACYSQLIAEQWRYLLQQAPSGTEPSVDPVRVIACCQATLLSAQTCQPESPEKLLRAHGLGA